MVAFSKLSRGALVTGVMCSIVHDNGHVTKNNTVNPSCGALARRLRAAQETFDSTLGSDEGSAASSEDQAQHNNSIFAGDEVSDISRIIEVMHEAERKLSEYGVEIPDAPKFVVIGKQSAGKSRLIETLAGEKFNYVEGGTASRRPTRITFKRDNKLYEDGKREWYLTGPAKDAVIDEDGKAIAMTSQELSEKLKKIHTSETVAVDVTALNGDIEQRHVKKIEEEEIELECRGTPYDLVITDMPGLMEAVEETDPDVPAIAVQNKKLIEGMVKKAFSSDANKIFLLDPATDLAKVDTIKVMKQKYFPEDVAKSTKAGDYSNVTYVRTKLDAKYDFLEGQPNINKWFRTEECDGSVCLDTAKGMKTHALSCPHWEAERANPDNKERAPLIVSNAEFQEKMEERDAADMALVERLQSTCDEQESSRENDSIIANVGFKNFVKNLTKDVHHMYQSQVSPVVNYLKNLQLQFKEDQETATHDAEIAKCVQHDTGMKFATALNIVMNESQSVSVNIDGKYDILRDSSLYTDAQAFADVFDKQKLFSEDLKIKADRNAGHGANYSQVSVAQIAKNNGIALLWEKQQFTAVNNYFVKHVKSLDPKNHIQDPSKVCLYSHIDEEDGFTFSKSKYETLIDDVIRYVSAAEPAFNLDHANGFQKNGAHCPVLIKTMISDAVAGHGKALLMHHVTVVGHRVKQMFLGLASRTRDFMSITLPQIAKQNQQAALRINPQFLELTNTPIGNETVYKAIRARYERYLDMLLVEFRHDFKQKLDLMLDDPFSILYTAKIRKPSRFDVTDIQFTERMDDIKKCADVPSADGEVDADRDACDYDSDDDDVIGVVGEDDDDSPSSSDDDDDSPPEVSDSSSRAPTTTAAADAPAASASAAVASTTVGDAKDRSQQIKDLIDAFASKDPANPERWIGRDNTYDSLKRVGGVIFKFAKTKIADSMKRQIDKFFFKRIIGNEKKLSFFTEELNKYETFQAYMLDMPTTCYQADDREVKRLKAKADTAKEKGKAVQESLMLFEPLL